jgi:hypothetical protein
VSKSTDDAEEDVPHPKREARIGQGRYPRLATESEQTERSRRIAAALADLRETNRRRRLS